MLVVMGPIMEIRPDLFAAAIVEFVGMLICCIHHFQMYDEPKISPPIPEE